MRLASSPVQRLLVLGGTQEARELCEALAPRVDIAVTLSLAGVTRTPRAVAIDTRYGGFGGPAGLAAYICANDITAVVDATHPFAARISANAAAACRATGCMLWRLERPAWSPTITRRGWRSVTNAPSAAEALTEYGPRVFLTVGARSLAAFTDVADKYWITRSIEAPEHPLTPSTHIRGRPPFSYAKEITLLRDYAVDVLVTKNSGAPMLADKLRAADAAGVAIIMIERPALSPADRAFSRVIDVLSALSGHQ